MRLVLKRHTGVDISDCEHAIRKAVAQLPPGSSMTMANVHARHQNDLDYLFRQAHGYRERHGNPFAQFDFLDEVPSADAAQLVALLRESSCYESVHQDHLTGSLVHPEPFAARAIAPLPQNYLKQSPIGVDSFAAKENPGGDGEGVAFTLIEKSFLLPHPDLPKIHCIYGEPRVETAAQPDHGTASLGIICSLDDGAGTVGIVPATVPRYAVAWPGESEVAIAILTAAAALHRGGVVVVNTQSEDKLPSETNELIFLAMELATAARRVVVACAGEGGLDLDQHPRLRRGSDQFRDSGAILVAAANDERRTRHSASNFGSRVDCYAWGGKVSTTYPPYGYAYASGASAATAIVGGCTISLQAMYKCRFGTAMDPAPLRDILKRTGTHPAAPSEKIGTMPDLQAAFLAIQERVQHTTSA